MITAPPSHIGTMCCLERWLTPFQRQSAFSRHIGHFPFDCVEQHEDPTLRDATRDENDSATAIVGRPAFEPSGRMKDMLDAMDNRGQVRAFRNIHNALET